MAHVLASENPNAAYTRGVILVLAAGLCWSIGGVLIRWTEGADAWQILLYRGLWLAIALTVVIAIKNRGRMLAAFRDAGAVSALAGFFLALANSFFVLGLAQTTVANVLFVIAAAPLISAPLSWWFLKEPVRRATWIAMTLSMGGIALMVANGLGEGRVLGNVFALAATIAFALFSLVLRSGSVRDGSSHDMTPTVWYAGAFTVVIAAAFIALDPAAGNTAATLFGKYTVSARDMMLCATMGVVQLAIGLTLYTMGARRLPATELILLSLVEVVAGPLWVWLAVNEVPDPLTLVGGAIVLGALAYQALSGARRKPPPMGP